MNSTLPADSTPNARDIVLDRFSQSPPWSIIYPNKAHRIVLGSIMGAITLLLVLSGLFLSSVPAPALWMMILLIGAAGIAMFFGYSPEETIHVRTFAYNPLSPELMRTRIDFID